MKTIYHMRLLFIFIFTLSSFTLNAQLFQVNSGKVKFVSDAPLELIQAESGKITGLLNTADRTFAFSIPMRTMQGFNSKLQQTHFNENYIETEKYPNATFEGKIIEEIDFSKDGKYKVRGKGKFKIHGVSQQRIIRCSLTIKGGKLIIKSNFSVLLADHDIKIPSVVAQKITEEVEVQMSCEMLKR